MFGKPFDSSHPSSNTSYLQLIKLHFHLVPYYCWFPDTSQLETYSIWFINSLVFTRFHRFPSLLNNFVQKHQHTNRKQTIFRDGNEVSISFKGGTKYEATTPKSSALNFIIRFCPQKTEKSHPPNKACNAAVYPQ